jgi:bacteriocin biosynthesis cyclodehydratase domain-containing protein
VTALPAHEATELPELPLLKPWYRVAYDGGKLVFEYGQSVVVVEGMAVQRLLPALLPLLDGTRTPAEMVARIGEPAGPAVEKCLALLARHGLLTAGPPLQAATVPPFAETATFFAAVARREVSPAQARGRLRGARLAVVGNGPPAEAVARLLRLSGIDHVVHLPWDAGRGVVAESDLLLAVPTSAELPQLERLNEVTLAARTVWLQLLPFDGRMAAIGPLYVPGETACYRCFRLRRAANIEYPEEQRQLDLVPAPFPGPPFLYDVVAGIGVRLALGWIVEQDGTLPGAFYAFEQGETLGLSHHVVYRVPRCPVCSPTVGQASPLPWYRG